MRLKRRLALAGLTATVITAAAAAVVLTAPTASADVSGTPFVTSSNSSDPHVIQCKDGSVSGYCLYTSQDMGQQYAYTPANYYPMRNTLVYFSPTGYNSWTLKATAFTESQLDGWVPRRTDCTTANPPKNNKPASGDVAGNCRAYHLWAPSAVRISDTEYYLFVPDVSNTSDTGTPNIHTSSRIAVARSTTGPFGPFSYQGTVDNASGYMSDPDIQVDGDNRYLVWADGDFSNCGGFKSAKLGTDMRAIQSGTTQTLTVNGVGVLGNCGGTGRPYMEGASLYKRSFNPTKPWTLIFAAKPDDTDNDGDADVPTECTSANTGAGSANTANEVIAWASASSAQGPYTYEGIVMCGSTTEWTNQATITTASNGRLIIIYHDSAAEVKERKLHAECLFVGPGVIGGVYRQNLTAAHGFNSCNGVAGSTDDSDYFGLWARDPQYPTLPTIISNNNTGDELKAERYWVGARERYKLEFVGAGPAGVAYEIRALSTGKLICASDSTTHLAATCTSSGETGATFIMESLPTAGQFRLKATNGKYLSVSMSGWVYASALDTATAATFVQLRPFPPA